MPRRDWNPIMVAAQAIVNGYTYLITLRQLHYRLVMTPGLGYLNNETDYKQLSARTAEARRSAGFPALLDQTRQIVKPNSWDDPADALNTIARIYALDRTRDQDWCIVVGGEKATLLAQLRQWYRDQHFPLVLLRGYGSQTYVDDVAEYVTNDGRKAVLIYAGDLDPSGEDILRDFTERCPVWDAVEHIAVTPSIVTQYSLPVNPGKVTDSRAKGFVARHGSLMQVEVEALPPDDLKALYDAAIDTYWDEATYDEVVAEEESGRALLEALQEAVKADRLALDGETLKLAALKRGRGRTS